MFTPLSISFAIGVAIVSLGVLAMRFPKIRATLLGGGAAILVAVIADLVARRISEDSITIWVSGISNLSGQPASAWAGLALGCAAGFLAGLAIASSGKN